MLKKYVKIGCSWIDNEPKMMINSVPKRFPPPISAKRRGKNPEVFKQVNCKSKVATRTYLIDENGYLID